jgi:hypothetical protein
MPVSKLHVQPIFLHFTAPTMPGIDHESIHYAMYLIQHLTSSSLGCIGVATLGVEMPTSCRMASWSLSLQNSVHCLGVGTIRFAALGVGLPASCMASRGSSLVFSRRCDGLRTIGVATLGVVSSLASRVSFLPYSQSSVGVGYIGVDARRRFSCIVSCGVRRLLLACLRHYVGVWTTGVSTLGVVLTASCRTTLKELRCHYWRVFSRMVVLTTTLIINIKASRNKGISSW